jgi:DNA-binding transcriptional MerR regulator
MLLRIGEFSQRSGVSAKTLRFYDEAGLLKPAVVDSRTRYRYYLPHQLKDLASIRAFRELGLSIRDLRGLSRSTTDRLAILETAKTTLDQSLLKTLDALAWVNSLLSEPHASQSDVAVVLKNRRPMQVAGLVAEVSSYSEIGEVERDLLRCVPQAFRGPLQGVFWHRCSATFSGGSVVGEPFVELRRRIPVVSGFAVRNLPAHRIACAYAAADDDESATNAYGAIRKWMDARGYQPAGSTCEIYHGPILEIQYPVQTV